MVRKTALGVGVTLALIMTPMPQAHAILFTGACAVELTFEFHSPVRSISNGPAAPDYDIWGVGADDVTAPLDPCAALLTAPNIGKDTDISAAGSSTLWTCESTVGGGGWNQGWEGQLPTIWNGIHWIEGTWGSWTMEVVDLNPQAFVGFIELTVHPDDIGKLSTCLTSGIDSLRMTGVMVFQDP